MDDIEFIEEGEDPKEKLKKIRDALAVCQKERDEYLAGWQRAKADFINARRDEEKEREKFRKFANTVLLYDLLLLADSLDMSAAHGADDGTQNIQRQFQELLKRYGVVPFESIGAPFAPSHHEALEEITVDDKTQSGIIIEEIQKGLEDVKEGRTTPIEKVAEELGVTLG